MCVLANFNILPYLSGLKSSVLTVKITSARAARRMLSQEKNPPITIMVNAGVIKPLVEALDWDDWYNLLIFGLIGIIVLH